MSNEGQVASVNVSEQVGTSKKPVAEIVIERQGVAGDAHAGSWHRQVSLLSQESIDSFAAKTGKQITAGEFAENITLAGIDLKAVGVFDRFRIGQVELEVTQLGKKCHGDGCAIYQELGQCVMPKAGLFCRVIQPGAVRPGDKVKHTITTLDFLIVTLSDRAAAGEYADRSGPRAQEILEQYLGDRGWHWRIQREVLADEADRLRDKLQKAISAETAAVFTLGGTGLGPRDITPETVAGLCEKTIPGIMEHIRLKFGEDKPSALLSRGVAGIAGQTLIYSLPGSVKAVEEYLGEILKSLEHALFMVRGVDVHRSSPVRARPGKND